MGITLLKLEPSAQIPWAKTMLGLASADMAGLLGSNRTGQDRRYRVRRTLRYLRARLTHPDTHPTQVANPFGASALVASPGVTSTRQRGRHEKAQDALVGGCCGTRGSGSGGDGCRGGPGRRSAR